MNKRDIIKEYRSFIQKHNLTPSEFIISSGGACVMHGVRKETNDMDMAVSKSFFNKLLATKKYETRMFKGWFDNLQMSLEYSDLISLHIGDIEKEYSNDVVMIDGVCCYSLTTLLEQKNKMNREKDQDDISKLKILISKNKPKYVNW